MVDDKKDLDNDYSALSDALDSGDPAPSLEDLLKDHGIDLGSDNDLDAMQDFSMREKSSESQPEFTDPFHSDEHLFSEDLFADSPVAPRDIKPTKKEQVVFDTPDIKASDVEVSDFDDTNTMFDEETTMGGGMKDDDALFDYDPHTEASFADLGGAEPEFGGGEGGDAGEGGSVPPPPESKANVKRIFARVGMLFVLASVIYGGMRLFMTEKKPTVAENEMAVPPPSKIAHMPKEKATQPTPPAIAAATTTTTTTTTTPAPVSPEMPAAVPTTPPPASLPAETTAATTATPAMTTTATPAEATPAATQPAMAAATTTPPAAAAMPAQATEPQTAYSLPQPQTSVPVTVPLAAVETPSDVHQKLDHLQQALQSIDQRLAQVNAGGTGSEQAQHLERLANDSNAPEMQKVLEDAVKKMKELDRKLERISELQQQVRKLDSDVKMLKEDVVAQTNMVGEQQRLFNDNVQLSQLQQPGPVKMVVQAAIPGRAWLRSERGELLTVIPGDEVPGYGRVVSIDAASGTVVTSSRAVFREQ